jgi:predicted nuclease of restriction endonuclease-like (RecB) superfamily
MVWDYAECNPFSNSTGNWSGAVNWIALVIERFPQRPAKTSVQQQDAQSDNGLRDLTVSTDPPYCDNISYADVADYFYVWMRHSLQSIFPDLQHFMVDLVFYNRLLKCYVLIDLKIGILKHQDLGQMQMYVHYFDRYVKENDEHPAVGILLCQEKDDAIVELTLPEGENIYASEYSLYLPDKTLLRQKLAEWTHEFEETRETLEVAEEPSEVKPMKFNFKIQPFQTEAVENIVGVFNGQPKQDRISYRRDVGKYERPAESHISLFPPSRFKMLLCLRCQECSLL